MESDLNSIGNSLENCWFLQNNPKGYEDEDFIKAIKDIKIGKTGYVYLMDSNGKLIVHPTKQGGSLAMKIMQKKYLIKRWYYFLYSKQQQVKIKWYLIDIFLNGICGNSRN